MYSVTLRTLPLSNIQRQQLVDVSAFVAAFGGRKKPVYLNDMAAIPLSFVFEHINKGAPSAVADRLCKAMISNYISNSKTFYVNRLVFADKLKACFVKKVMPLIRNFLMLACKSNDCFLSVVRSF